MNSDIYVQNYTYIFHFKFFDFVLVCQSVFCNHGQFQWIFRHFREVNFKIIPTMVDNLNAMFSHLRAENFKKFANHGEFECIFNHLRNGTLKLRISKAQPDFLYTFFCCNIHVSMYSNFSLFIENYCPRRCISSKVGVPKYDFFFSPHHRGLRGSQVEVQIVVDLWNAGSRNF